MVITFYGDQVWYEYEKWADIPNDLPYGCYAHDTNNGEWYRVYYAAPIAIPTNEVPAMCKAWLLIL